MTENRYINTGGGRYIENQGIYYENYQQSPSLAEAAAEIQLLLEQLDKTYSTNTTEGKKAIASKTPNCFTLARKESTSNQCN